MAARFGAVIVPFGAIGCEDSLEYILDSEEVRRRASVLPPASNFSQRCFARI